MKRRTLLLVEDDSDLALGLRDALESEGYEFAHLEDGTGVPRCLQQMHPDLIILDAMLPGASGFEVLRRIRELDREVMVLMLTARGQEMDRVRGLQLGADDYVTKPFSLMELLARISALLRRARPQRSRLRLGRVEVDLAARVAERAGMRIELTVREFEILNRLSQHPGEAVSREQLIGAIWGTQDEVQVSTRTVDQHIASLRRKLGQSAADTIETVYGYGYRLNP